MSSLMLLKQSNKLYYLELIYLFFKVTGLVQRYRPAHPNCDFAQPGALFRKVMTVDDRAHLIKNISGALKGANRDVFILKKN